MIAEKGVVDKRKITIVQLQGKIPKISCRGIGEIFKIEKASAATIIKNKEKLRKEYASFQDKRKRNRQGKFHKFNDAV